MLNSYKSLGSLGTPPFFDKLRRTFEISLWQCDTEQKHKQRTSDFALCKPFT